MKMELKVGQFYKFIPNMLWVKHRAESGILYENIFAVVDYRGELKFKDIYWSNYYKSQWVYEFPGRDRVINLDWIEKYGKIEFICDMDLVEPIRSSDVKYYDENDIFLLTSQYGSNKYFFKTKDAKKSSVAMVEYLISERKKHKSSLIFLKREIEAIDKKLDRLNNGEIEGIYL